MEIPLTDYEVLKERSRLSKEKDFEVQCYFLTLHEDHKEFINLMLKRFNESRIDTDGSITRYIYRSEPLNLSERTIELLNVMLNKRSYNLIVQERRDGTTEEYVYHCVFQRLN